MRRYLLILLVVFASCHDAPQPSEEEKATPMFSIRDFAKDEWDLMHGQPYVMERYMVLNGVESRDTLPMVDIDWASVFRTFLNADIGKSKLDTALSKYAGRYRFSYFTDESFATKNFVYEAKEPGLFTRSLQLTIDMFTYHKKSLYIETRHEDLVTQRVQKLYYSPLKIVQIQEMTTNKIGPDKNLRVEYRFLN